MKFTGFQGFQISHVCVWYYRQNNYNDLTMHTLLEQQLMWMILLQKFGAMACMSM